MWGTRYRNNRRNNRSHRWNGVPPGIMKLQLRILRLRLRMTAPREPMRLIFKADLRFDTTVLTPGLRLAVGLSGGADSVALLRALVERSAELGLVLHVAHLHHGLR